MDWPSIETLSTPIYKSRTMPTHHNGWTNWYNILWLLALQTVHHQGEHLIIFGRPRRIGLPFFKWRAKFEWSPTGRADLIGSATHRQHQPRLTTAKLVTLVGYATIVYTGTACRPLSCYEYNVGGKKLWWEPEYLRKSSVTFTKLSSLLSWLDNGWK